MGRKNKQETREEASNLKHRLSDLLDLPKEVVLNLPLISMTGREDLNIENYKGIVEYSEDRIRINTTAGILKIEGKNLLLKQITAEHINITGGITSLEYLI